MSTQTKEQTEITAPLKNIKPSRYQARDGEDVEHVLSIALSIAQDGMQSKPLARPAAKKDHYELAYGNTRFSAYKLLDKLSKRKKQIEQLDDYLISAELWALTRDSAGTWAEIPLKVRDLSERELFEQGAIENGLRKDLDDIELAQHIEFYMQHFDGTTSKDASAIFGKSASTIRGLRRLLNLPEVTQQALKNGKISQESARKVLRLKSITPGALEQYTDRIVASGPISQREVDMKMQNMLSNQPNVRVLWGTYETGKEKPALAGRHLWPLTWENYHIRDITPNAVMKALKGSGIFAAILQEIIAVAHSENEQGEKKWAEDVFADIVAEIRDNNATPDELLENFGLSQTVSETVRAMIYPLPCNMCPLYTKVGEQHFCGSQVCHKLKRSEYKEWLQADLSKSLGIKVYNKEADGPEFERAERYHGHRWPPSNNEETFWVQWFEDRADHLRLICNPRFSPNNFDFTDSNIIELISIDVNKVREKEAEREAQSEQQSAQTQSGDGSPSFNAEEAAAEAAEQQARAEEEKRLNEMRESCWEQAGPIVWFHVAPFIVDNLSAGGAALWRSILEYILNPYDVAEITSDLTDDEDYQAKDEAEQQQELRKLMLQHVVTNCMLADLREGFTDLIDGIDDVFERIKIVSERYLGPIVTARPGFELPDFKKMSQAEEE